MPVGMAESRRARSSEGIRASSARAGDPHRASRTLDPEAVKWLRRSYRAGAVMDAVATIEMLLPDRLDTLGG